MGGEAGSATRPINSLLEEDLNFDHTTAAGSYSHTKAAYISHIVFFGLNLKKKKK